MRGLTLRPRRVAYKVSIGLQSQMAESSHIAFPENSSLDLPYQPEYLELLQEINDRSILQHDLKYPETTAEEEKAAILKDGVMVKQGHSAAKAHIISPELAKHCMMIHAQDQLVEKVNNNSTILCLRLVDKKTHTGKSNT